MVIFNSYVSLPEGIVKWKENLDSYSRWTSTAWRGALLHPVPWHCHARARLPTLPHAAWGGKTGTKNCMKNPGNREVTGKNVVLDHLTVHFTNLPTIDLIWCYVRIHCIEATRIQKHGMPEGAFEQSIDYKRRLAEERRCPTWWKNVDQWTCNNGTMNSIAHRIHVCNIW